MMEWILLVAIVTYDSMSTERFGPYPEDHLCYTAAKSLHVERTYQARHGSNVSLLYSISCVPQPKDDE